ncbi:MAG: hypothetical protein RIQ33_1694 [Bacteroidota bacterium]
MASKVLSYSNCIDEKSPRKCEGDKASYVLEIKTKDILTAKYDADCIKVDSKITHKICDAFFVLNHSNKQKHLKPKMILVETKGENFEHAILQLKKSFEFAKSADIELSGRIIGRRVPSLKKNKSYQDLSEIFEGRLRTKSIKMIESYSTWDNFVIN